MSREEINRIAETVNRIFSAGRMKDFETLRGLHHPDLSFTRFSDLPPFSRQGPEEALRLKESLFRDLIDFDYKIEDINVDLYGDVAVATFYIDYRGVYVYSYTFEGRDFRQKARCTFVFHRKDSFWYLVHEHLSKFPEGPEVEGPG